MKTSYKTLGLAALLTVALAPVGLFAQDGTAPPLAQNDTATQDQVQPVAQDQNLEQQNQNVQAQDQNAQSQDPNNVTFQTFYNQLSSQGTWIQTDNYGYVWQPANVGSNWAPYTYGNWVNTNQGMMWNSDESFGWATYHYGRWINLADYGWVWVPGYTWAPAWVSWRDGDDYAGWAPLPPDTFLGIDFVDSGWGWDSGWGFHIGDDCDTAYGIGPGCYNFVPVAYLGDRHPWRHFADHRDNFALINHTRNVTNLNVSRDPNGRGFGRVHAGGPDAATLARSRTAFHTENLVATNRLAANDRRNGDTVSVYAPNVRADSAGTARPRRVSASLGSVTANRGTDISHPLAVNSHFRGVIPTAAQVQTASTAAAGAPAGARIARTGGTFAHTLNRPLTSYHPSTTAGNNFRASTTASTPAVNHPAATAQGSSFFGGFFNHSNASTEPTHVSHSSNANTASHSSSFFGGFFNRSNASSEPTHQTHESSSPSDHSSSSSFSSFFHQSSAPAYHPSDHPAPVAHFGGGGGGGMHFGGGGTPHFGGGGGGVHASAGQAGGGGGGGGHSVGGGHSGGGGGGGRHH